VYETGIPVIPPALVGYVRLFSVVLGPPSSMPSSLIPLTELTPVHLLGPSFNI